jgi:uncharacterized protein YndB with AHSA1/START domain
MATSRSGYLLIADITGYTGYLSHSELEHAQGVLGRLLELLIEHVRPPLVISRLAGDAVISYALEGGSLDGQGLVDGIERTYVAFRTAIERMVLNNTCRCNACANVGALDLKFFLHYGVFGVQRLGGHDELVGTDVNLIHRLLKNRVLEQTGIVAYAMYTEAALERLGLKGFRDSLVAHQEAYEHLGPVRAWVQDLRPVWERRRAQQRITVPADRMLAEARTEIAMPPELVWDYLNSAEFRAVLLAADRADTAGLHNGRMDVGSVIQCFHGDRLIPLTVLEWDPPTRLLTEVLLPLPIRSTYQMFEYVLEPSAKGTWLIQRVARARGPLVGRLLADFIMSRGMKKQGVQDLEKFRDRIQADLATRTESLPAGVAFSAESIREAAAASLVPLAASAAEPGTHTPSGSRSG